MKITLEHCGNKISYEVAHEDVGLNKMLDILEHLLLADGYIFTGNLTIVEQDPEDELAKYQAIEKQQMIEFASEYADHVMAGMIKSAEQYYNETFKLESDEK